MSKFEQFKMTLRFSTTFFLCAILTGVYYVVWDNVYNPEFENQFIGKGKIFLVTVYFLILIVSSIVLEASKVDKYRKSELIFYQILAVIFTNAIAYAQICLLEAVLANIFGMIYIFIIQAAIITVWIFASTKIVRKLNPPEEMLIIYGSHLATEIVYKMSEMVDRYKINESINVDEGYDEIISKIDKFKSVIICDVPARMRNDILKYCYQHNKGIYIVPKISDIIVRSASEITYFDSPILHAYSEGLSIEQRAVKRTFDIVSSLLALIIFSPIFLVIALAIKLYDGGPVFYKQARATRNMRVFEILKFRSMIVDAEKDGPKPATENDSRITPVGKVIRALRVDELPQLINILKGDMSVVGPRPERVEHVEKYSKEIEEFPYRYKVRGGLTGYAQVFGKYNTSPYNKLKMDLMYIQNYSLALDIKLIIMTIKILFKKESTEGFKEKKEKSKEK